MSTQAAKRHAAREKRRRLLERIALVALAALLVFSATPVGRAFWDRLYARSGFRGAASPSVRAGFRQNPGPGSSSIFTCIFSTNSTNPASAGRQPRRCHQYSCSKYYFSHSISPYRLFFIPGNHQ